VSSLREDESDPLVAYAGVFVEGGSFQVDDQEFAIDLVTNGLAREFVAGKRVILHMRKKAGGPYVVERVLAVPSTAFVTLTGAMALGDGGRLLLNVDGAAPVKLDVTTFLAKGFIEGGRARVSGYADGEDGLIAVSFNDRIPGELRAYRGTLKKNPTGYMLHLGGTQFMMLDLGSIEGPAGDQTVDLTGRYRVIPNRGLVFVVETLAVL